MTRLPARPFGGNPYRVPPYDFWRMHSKRPKLAEPLPGPKPSLTIDSKQTRYDVYLTAAG